MKVRELAEAASISIESMLKILHKDSGMRKVTAKQVPYLLTIDQKCQRVGDSKSCSDLINCNWSDFLRRLVTNDETWYHHYAPESEQQEKQWVGSGGTAPKRADTTIGYKGYGFCFLGF